MPNHIQNRLKFIGKKADIKKLMAAISSTEDDKHIAMDFKKIIPMADSLNIESGSSGELAHSLLFGGGRALFPVERNQETFKKLDPKERERCVALALQYQLNIENFGHSTWYNWSIENWGTKWNAYGQPDERNTEDTIFFQTAWSAPHPVILKLSNLFPKVKIELTYADEDSGSNTGEILYEDGGIISEHFPDSQSKEGYDLYFELHPGSKDCYRLVNGNYEYIDDED